MCIERRKRLWVSLIVSFCRVSLARHPHEHNIYIQIKIMNFIEREREIEGEREREERESERNMPTDLDAVGVDAGEIVDN